MAGGSDKAAGSGAVGAGLAWLTLVVRFAGFAAGTAGLAVFWLAGRAVAGGRRRVRLRERVVRAWGRTGLWALGVRARARGPLPPAPCLLVSNHVSYADILVYSAILGASFVSMAELRRWPVFGRLADAAGTVFLDRGRKRELVLVNERISRVLAEGRRLVLFAEGTNSDGSGVRPFKPSLLEPAVRGSIPVHYAAVTYETRSPDPPASRHVAWFGGAPFLPHAMRLMRGRRAVAADVRFAERPVGGVDRKRLAEDLHRGVLALFQPLARS